MVLFTPSYYSSLYCISQALCTIYFLLHFYLFYFNILTSYIVYFVLFFSLLCLQGATVMKQFPPGIKIKYSDWLINWLIGQMIDSLSCHSNSSSSISPCPLHPFVSQQLSAHHFSPHPWISSLVFHFASCLLTPSSSSYYQYIHCLSSAPSQCGHAYLVFKTPNQCCPSDVLIHNPVPSRHFQRESQHL